MTQSHFESDTTFTCPICLSERSHLPPESNGNDNKKPDPPESTEQDERPVFHANQNPDPPGLTNQNQGGSPIFQLTACSHKFCAACLKAYVRSKLLDGKVDVPCCHFNLSPWEDTFHPCNVLIQEADLYKLIHMITCCDESNRDEWCCEDIHNSSLFSPHIGNNKGNSDGDQLWKKYQKLLFDKHHGKDVVRRCPKCDEAQLFDEECMKEYQTKYLVQNDNNAAAGAGGTANNENNLSAGNMNRFERVFNGFRQMQRHTEDTSAATIREKDEASKPMPEGEENTQKMNEQKEDYSAGVNLSPTPTGEEEACNSLDGEGSDVSTGIKSFETKQNASEENKSPSLVKSTVPVITCQTCDTEFCYFHSNAHSGKSCVEYHKQSLESDRANIEYANVTLHAKPCPNCGISVSKEGGCNQMKCGSCGTHFCWICREIVDDGAFPEHFRWWNLRGCANMQLDEAEETLRCTIWGAKLLSAFQIIVLGIPAVTLALISMILCPCFVLGCGRTKRERIVNSISFWGSFMSSLLLLPFTCLGMVLILTAYWFVAVFACFVKAFTSQQGQGRNSDVSENASVGGTSRDVTASGNAASPEDFIRELESIFERMEEGITTT